MPAYTPNKGYPQPTVGGDANQWGTELNSGISILDANMGGVAAVNVAGSANITPTALQTQSLVQRLAGTLTANISYILPPVGSFYVIDNQSAGAFTITAITSATGSAGVSVPQGSAMHVYSDGTNIYPADRLRSGAASGLGTTPVGAGMDFWGSTAPPGWYFAYGQAVSRTTYAALFAAIGTTYGAGDGSTTFNLPDKRARVSIPMDDMGGTAANLVTTAGSGVDGTTLGAVGGSQYQQGHVHSTTDPGHTHVLTDPGHTHGVTDPGHIHTIGDDGHVHPQPNAVSITAAYPNVYGTTAGLLIAQEDGVSTGAAMTGITITNATTGISNAGAETGLLITGAYTGLGIVSTGAGSSQNMVPGIVCNYIIYGGV